MYPMKSRVKEITRKLREVFRKNYNLNSYNLITLLNPTIKEWASYFNLGNSSTFRDYVKQALFRFAWKWAFRKHPKWGKNKIAKSYFRPESGSLDRGNKWNFCGEYITFSKYNNKDIKYCYLVDPTNVVGTISAFKYLIPDYLKGIHAFHTDWLKVKWINIKGNLFCQGYYGSFKENMVMRQNSICPVCNKTLFFHNMNDDSFSLEDLHIQHILPFSATHTTGKVVAKVANSKKDHKNRIKNMILIHRSCQAEFKNEFVSQFKKGCCK
jgi:hypothetical protein